MDLKQQVKRIKSLPLFKWLASQDILTMLNTNIIRMMSFEPDERIITEKSFDRKIYMILNGKVKVVKNVVEGDLKTSKELKELSGNGILLGEITAFTGKPRTASVVAAEPTACVMVNIGLLMETSSELLERVKTKFYPKLFSLLCIRLDETNDQVMALKQKNEQLGKRLKESSLNMLNLKKEHFEDLKRKNKRIKELEARLE